MYPSIFSLSVANIGHLKSRVSGLLHVGIVGGAIIPMCQSIIADTMGIRLSYLLPASLYLIVVLYTVVFSSR